MPAMRLDALKPQILPLEAFPTLDRISSDFAKQLEEKHTQAPSLMQPTE